jgi:thiamine pyrophosphate-dependent acetolactate synthase large subunit-like protein
VTHAGVLAARTLRAHDVETVFTLNGGHIWPLYDGCVQEGIRLVDTRHEQTAAFAAEGWAKVTRRVGVAALTAGPGVTNGISAITSAWLNGTPMFVAGGRAPDGRWGQGSLQELDHVPIVASITKCAVTAHAPDEVPVVFDRALRSAQTPHRGPSFVDVPLDRWGAAEAPAPERIDARQLHGPVADADAIGRVADLLANADRPVLLVGGDVYWAGAEAEVRALVETAMLPAFANDMGRGVLPADHDLSFGRARSIAFREADVLIVAGTSLDFRLSFGRVPQAAVVHLVDAPGLVATHTELAASIAGDLRHALGGLAERGVATRPSTRASWVARLREEERAARAKDEPRLNSDATPIDPVRVYGELRRRLDRDGIVVGDGGDFVSYAGRYVDTYTPGCFLGPGPYGCLGSGTGYALAAALAHPERQTVALFGDGALGFSLADFDTLARHRANVVAIVGNNGVWGLEKHPMQALFGYDVVCDLAPATRYDLVAQDLGCYGEFVKEPGALGPALDRAFAFDGPSLVNVLTDPDDAYPRSSSLG